MLLSNEIIIEDLNAKVSLEEPPYPHQCNFYKMHPFRFSASYLFLLIYGKECHRSSPLTSISSGMRSPVPDSHQSNNA